MTNKEIFKKLNRIGYIPYLYNTVEKLKFLDIKSKDFSIEFNLIVYWFNEKYNLYSCISLFDCIDRNDLSKSIYKYKVDVTRTVEKENSICKITTYHSDFYNARLNCILKLLEMVGE